jgi:hypothetical protein
MVLQVKNNEDVEGGDADAPDERQAEERAMAEPMTSARSQAAMASSQMIQRAMVMGRE